MRKRVNLSAFLLLTSILLFVSRVATNAQTYCTPVASTDNEEYINSFSTTGGILNISNLNSGYSTNGYGIFTTDTVSAIAGTTINISGVLALGTYGVNVWVDWNQDGDFDDAGEKVYNSGGYVGSISGSFLVPLTAMAGTTRMRVRADFDNANGPTPCGALVNDRGEAEDYDFTVIALVPCSGQPTAGTLPASMSVCPDISFTITATGASLQSTGLTSQWQSRPAGAGTWTNIAGATTATYTASNTGINTPTDFRYFVFCSNSNLSDTSTVLPITINEPDACYCTPVASTSSEYYFDNFSTTGTPGTVNINNANSGFSPNGYGNFTGDTVSAIQGNTVSFSGSISESTMGVNVWVDWNHDGNFNGADELVYNSGGYVGAAVNGSFTVPLTAMVGPTRLRIRGDEDVADGPDPCDALEDGNGEAEDYTFVVISSVVCDTVTGLSVTSIGDTSAVVNWGAVNGSGGYQVVVSTSSSLPGSGTPAAGTSYTATGLQPITTYYAFVRNSCGNGSYSSWTKISFTTTAPVCDTVTGITATNITSNSAVISWDSVSGAVGYQMITDISPIAPVGGAFTIPVTSTPTTNLTDSTTYYVYVRTDCGDTVSAWGVVKFTTLSTEGVNNIAGNNFEITAYPNPAKDVVTININGSKVQNSTIQLMDVTGKIIDQVSTKESKIELDMKGLAAGIYLIKYKDADHSKVISISKE